MIGRTLLGALFVTIALVPSARAQDFPKFTNHVVDAAEIVPDDVENEINAQLSDHQRRLGNQIAIAVIETTGRDSIEDYTNDLFEEWGVGDAEEDNGVLLVIAMEDRRLRIETGFGVEDELTDLESGRIIRNHLTPRLREGDLPDALRVGANEIRRALGDEEVGAPPQPIAQPEERDGGGISPLLFLIPFFIFGPLSAIGRRGRRRRGWVTPIFLGGAWGGLGGGSGGGGFGGGGFGGGGGGGSGGGGASGGW